MASGSAVTRYMIKFNAKDSTIKVWEMKDFQCVGYFKGKTKQNQ